MGVFLCHLTGGLNLWSLDWRGVSFLFFVPGEGCGASLCFVFAGPLLSSFTHTYSLVTHVHAVASRFIRWPHSSSAQAGSWIVKTFVHLFPYIVNFCVCAHRACIFLIIVWFFNAKFTSRHPFLIFGVRRGSFFLLSVSVLNYW